MLTCITIIPKEDRLQYLRSKYRGEHSASPCEKTQEKNTPKPDEEDDDMVQGPNSKVSLLDQHTQLKIEAKGFYII